MAALAVQYDGRFGMAERSNVGVGFTDEDRKVLITVQVKMERLETDVRDGLQRIAKLESDRVTKKDVEDLLGVVQSREEENEAVARKVATLEEQMKEMRPQVDWLRKYAWLLMGAGFVLNFVLGKIWK